MKVNKIFLGFFIIFAICSVAGMPSVAKADGAITLSQASNVTVTFVSSSAASDDPFGISSPISRALGSGHTTNPGTTFSLGQLPAGSLVFYIQNGFSGFISNQVHITTLGANNWQLAFEDLPYGGDGDYNDVIITVTATPTTPVTPVVPVTPACTSHAEKRCAGSEAGYAVSYWYDSCGVKQDKAETCPLDYGCFSGTCQYVQCSTNSYCGTDGFVSGTKTCQNGNVYQTYRTYTCTNPQTPNAQCNHTDQLRQVQACSANQTCSNGQCVTQAQNITCSSNTDCGTSAYTGSPFCQGSNVYQNYTTYTCNNSGSANSYCSTNTVAQQKTACTGNQTCSNGTCNNQVNTCTSHAYQQCNGNNLTWFDSCGVAQDSQYCQNGCSGNTCQNYTNYCTQSAYQRCSGNYLYWYDSCGNIQGQGQYCQNGCSGNTCNYNNYNYNNNYYNSYGNCTYHAYQLCVGNSTYWYDSCGVQQDLAQTCAGTNMTCKYGLCVYQQPAQPIFNPYVSHYKIACYSKNLNWFDSLGKVSGVYKSCADSNSCTQDSCASGKCSNTLKCDGSTCATGSADFNTYCATNNNNNNNPTNNTTTALSTAFFVKQSATTDQWEKTAQVGQNSTVYFMISVGNNGTTQVDNINVLANIPSEISLLGNLQINGVPFTGDIVSGINIGSLPAGTGKSITFEGKTQALSTQATEQATETVGGQINSVSISFNPSLGTAAVSSVSNSQATSTNGFWEFLKRWYLWIIAAIVLIFLFVIVFRRLSSNEE